MKCLPRSRRRFNIVVLPTPSDMETEMEIVRTRVAQLSTGLDLNAKQPDKDTVEKVVTIFRELRSGRNAGRQTEAQRDERRSLYGGGNLPACKLHGAGRKLRQR